jgi:palmitoyltransferase ZDHHC3/7/25
MEGLVEMSEHLNLPNINGLTSNVALLEMNSGDLTTTIGHGTALPTLSSSTTNATAPIIATVRRNKFGTSPFDEQWLNVDCCGLFCAGITYLLHCYGVYAVCIILIPPWMSTTDAVTGLRSLSFMGHFHRLAFTFVAVMAVYAHAKAMMTDPGAVPPDAMPLEELRKQQLLLEQSNGGDLVEGGEAPKSPLQQQQRKGKRLCRRCNAFKPKRAHHCSVCQRCIIKMDRTCHISTYCTTCEMELFMGAFVHSTARSNGVKLTTVEFPPPLPLERALCFVLYRSPLYPACTPFLWY